ncbi:MAG: exonuclease subunit SbcD [Actinomycetota bacterium]|nr:exonuclease subunit SbcD [Actinomycetota bacterium]
MKLLHTGDWHVGKTLRGRSRAEEHRAVLREIAELAATEAVDVVMVAGDLFDSASPSPEAEGIVYDALLQLTQSGARVVVVAGNHDNPRRLLAVEPLLALGRVVVRPLVQSPQEGGVVEITSPAGEPARIAMLPWLSQRDIVKADRLMSDEADELADTYRERASRIIVSLTTGFSPDSVNIVLGHLTVAGAQIGGGERTAQTVFDYYVDATAFPSDAHYVALGHLHKPQKMPAGTPVHYCGSPLWLDFSDDVEHKVTMIVEASPGAPAQIRAIPLKAGRRLRTLSGTVAELAGLAGKTGDDLLRVRVEEQARAGLGDEVRAMFPEAVDVMAAPADSPTRDRARSEASANPRALFGEYLAERNVGDERLIELFDRLLEETYASASA